MRALLNRLESNVAKLGNLSAPVDTDLQSASMIRCVVAKSFIFGFRLIMLLCAGLATASAAVAWREIPAESAARAPDLGDVAAAE
jgi:hypothetical protein